MEQNERNIAFTLGLAQKAGKAASGALAVETALKNGKAELLVLARDIAPGIQKELRRLAAQKEIPVLLALDKNALGTAIGKEQRSAVAICDANFAKMLMR